MSYSMTFLLCPCPILLCDLWCLVPASSVCWAVTQALQLISHWFGATWGGNASRGRAHFPRSALLVQHFQLQLQLLWGLLPLVPPTHIFSLCDFLLLTLLGDLRCLKLASLHFCHLGNPHMKVLRTVTVSCLVYVPRTPLHPQSSYSNGSVKHQASSQC